MSGNISHEDTDKQMYLNNFRRENNPERMGFPQLSKKVGENLVNIMKKEDLSYDEAYASLQYAYNLLKFESNFLKI